MSTRCTLAYGKTFHLFYDLAEEENDQDVFLELDSPEFEVEHHGDQTRISVRIPIAIWETIRSVGAPDLSLMKVTDDELQARVEKDVDERIREFGQGKDWVSLLGFAVYGAASEPREAQIASGVAWYKAERAKQQAVAAAIEALRSEAKVYDRR